MNKIHIIAVAALFLSGCSPAPQDTAPPASSVVAEPSAELLPTLSSTPSSVLGDTFSVTLAQYVQSVAVCDHLTPGLLDTAKEELRASLGPELWSTEEEASTDHFRDGEGARIAAQMRSAIASAGPGSRYVITRACARDIADNKRALINAMDAIINAAGGD